MKKTESKSKQNSLTLILWCEAGRCELSIGLDGLSRAERTFFFDTLKGTKEGGSAGFSLHPADDGMRLTLLLKEPASVALN